MATPYSTLNVPITATASDIRAAFKDAILTHHPDKGGEPSRFRLAKAAYDILSDQSARHDWDNATGTSYTQFKRACDHERVKVGMNAKSQPKTHPPQSYSAPPKPQSYSTPPKPDDYWNPPMSPKPRPQPYGGTAKNAENFKRNTDTPRPFAWKWDADEDPIWKRSNKPGFRCSCYPPPGKTTPFFHTTREHCVQWFVENL